MKADKPVEAIDDSATKAGAAPPGSSASLSESQPPPVRLSLIDRSRIMRDVFTVVALSIAGIWALVTFWYNSTYLPAHEQPIVTPTMTITVMGEKDGKVALNAHLTLRNDGRARQNTWGMTFHAYAQKVTFAPLTDGGWRDQHGTDASFIGDRDFHAEPYALIASSVDLMTQAGRSNPLLPHSELHWDFYFYVDKASADAVTVYVDVLHPEKDIPPKPEWFTLKEEPEVTIVATAACHADKNCQAFHTQFAKSLSLWR